MSIHNPQYHAPTYTIGKCAVILGILSLVSCAYVGLILILKMTGLLMALAAPLAVLVIVTASILAFWLVFVLVSVYIDLAEPNKPKY